MNPSRLNGLLLASVAVLCGFSLLNCQPGGFAGTYPIEGEGGSYAGNLTVKKAKGDSYTLHWEYEDMTEAEGVGIQVAGYLGFGDSGAGGVVGIYKKQDGGLSGLWAPVEGDLVMVERSPNVPRLYASPNDISGTYRVKGASSDGGDSYRKTLSIEEMGNTWVVSAESEDGFITVGMGLAVDNVLVTAFGALDTKIITVYEINGDELDGKWVYVYYDDEKQRKVTVTGWEKGRKR